MEFFYSVTPREKRVREATYAKGTSPSQPGPDVIEGMWDLLSEIQNKRYSKTCRIKHSVPWIKNTFFSFSQNFPVKL